MQFLLLVLVLPNSANGRCTSCTTTGHSFSNLTNEHPKSSAILLFFRLKRFYKQCATSTLSERVVARVGYHSTLRVFTENEGGSSINNPRASRMYVIHEYVPIYYAVRVRVL